MRLAEFLNGATATQTMVLREDGRALISTTQDTAPILEANHPVFSALAQGGTGNAIVAQNIVQATSPNPVTIVGAVDVYLSDFGRLDLAPDIFMPDNYLEIIDIDYVELAPLPGRDTDNYLEIIDIDYVELAPLPGRDMVLEEYAKVGDAQDGGVVFEGTLRVTAPRAHAMVGDLE